MIWFAIAGTALGCYLLKLGGLLVPARILRRPAVARFAELLPVALLTALVAVATFASGRHLVLVVTAAAVTALVRLAA